MSGDAFFQLPREKCMEALAFALCTSFFMPRSTLSPSQEHCGLQVLLGETSPL